MLLSHRCHRPGFGDALLTVDRAITPSFIVKRVRLLDIAQDERLTKSALGVDSDRPRRRLSIVLGGTILETVEGKELTIGAGQALYVTERQGFASLSRNSDVIEVEWDPGALGDDGLCEGGAFSLGTTRGHVSEIAHRLSEARSIEESRLEVARLMRLLCAEGLAVAPEPVLATPLATAGEQELMAHVDATLSDLAGAPMLVDLEGSLDRSRRTLTRNIRRLHERYGLLGRGAGRWRGIRDVYRLVIATVLLSHEEATPGRVAGLVGYTTVDALDHAFRHASLPSPARLRRAILAA